MTLGDCATQELGDFLTHPNIFRPPRLLPPYAQHSWIPLLLGSIGFSPFAQSLPTRVAHMMDSSQMLLAIWTILSENLDRKILVYESGIDNCCAFLVYAKHNHIR